MARKRAGVAVIGAGNWGVSLIAALRRAGVGPVEVVRRRGWPRARLDARVLWLCVPDAAIAECSKRIAEHVTEHGGNLRGRIVVHSSGSRPASVLEVAQRAGARIGAVHPVMTFPTRRVVSLKGAMFGVETADAVTRRALNVLIRRMGGVPFLLPAATKALYHAAGSLASPLLVSTLTAAMETAELAGLDARTAAKWVRALAEATVGNVFAHGAARSFSGPFARGDAETVLLHLQALADHPILANIYQSLARHAVATLPVRNRAALEAALSEFQHIK